MKGYGCGLVVCHSWPPQLCGIYRIHLSCSLSTALHSCRRTGVVRSHQVGSIFSRLLCASPAVFRDQARSGCRENTVTYLRVVLCSHRHHSTSCSRLFPLPPLGEPGLLFAAHQTPVSVGRNVGVWHHRRRPTLDIPSHSWPGQYCRSGGFALLLLG